ncbi:MAG: RHS repeat domain-containing protein [Oscillospiraceae bacterium]
MKRTVKNRGRPGRRDPLHLQCGGAYPFSSTDQCGDTTTYDDQAGNETKETSPDGSSYSFRYDENSNIIALTDQLGNVTRYEYDALTGRYP